MGETSRKPEYSGLGLKERSQKLTATWSNLSLEEKKGWEAKSKELKKKYEEEYRAYSNHAAVKKYKKAVANINAKPKGAPKRVAGAAPAKGAGKGRAGGGRGRGRGRGAAALAEAAAASDSDSDVMGSDSDDSSSSNESD